MFLGCTLFRLACREAGPWSVGWSHWKYKCPPPHAKHGRVHVGATCPRIPQVPQKHPLDCLDAKRLSCSSGSRQRNLRKRWRQICFRETNLSKLSGTTCREPLLKVASLRPCKQTDMHSSMRRPKPARAADDAKPMLRPRPACAAAANYY